MKRVAIYVRKSTTMGLEQDFNSLDSQTAAIRAYIDALNKICYDESVKS